MNVPGPSTPEPSRRRVPHVGWLILALVVLVVVAFTVTVVVPCYRQVALVDWIRSHGGNVDMEPVGPEWLREWMGDDGMRGFDRIWSIGVSDASDLPTAFDNFAAIRELTHVSVEGGRIDKMALTRIAELPKLDALSLSDLILDGVGFASLKEHFHLQELHLENVKLTVRDWEVLGAMPHLESLSFIRMPIRDSEITAIPQLSRLTYLCLDYTAVTDAGLVHLERLTDLKLLFLTGTKVTEEAVKRLKSILPDCEVVSDFDVSEILGHWD